MELWLVWIEGVGCMCSNEVAVHSYRDLADGEVSRDLNSSARWCEIRIHHEVKAVARHRRTGHLCCCGGVTIHPRACNDGPQTTRGE